MPKFFSRIVQRILHRTKKAVISVPSHKDKDVFSSPGQPPAEKIVEEVTLVRHHAFLSSKREKSNGSATGSRRPMRRLSTAAELDRQLMLMRDSRTVPLREPFAMSTSSVASGKNYPLILSDKSRLAEFAEVEYFEAFKSRFELSQATTFRISEVPSYVAYSSQNHCFFRTSRPCQECLESDDDDLFSEYGFSRSIPPAVTSQPTQGSLCA